MIPKDIFDNSRKYTKHSTIPGAVAMTIAVFIMAPFSLSRNSLKKASTCAYKL